MSSATLLVELFTEELPPKALKRLGDAFTEGITSELNRRGLLESNHRMQMFATPRRLAVTVTNVRAVAPDESFTEKLMPVAVGLDKDGKATPALLKKLAAKSLSHVEPSQLLRENDGKAEQLIYRGIAKGQSLHVALEAALALAISGLPVPKVMSYQLADGVTTVQFVRPAHGLVALHGEEIIRVHALGLTAGRTTHGHRFQGAEDIELKHADEYEARLENEGGVIASFEKRRAEIMRLLFAHAEQTGDTLGEPEDYAALLDEVTGLVERPTVYVGKFDAEFLEVPAECLVLTMKLNQKYFPLYLSEGGLSSRFLIVSNMRLDNPHNVIEGNQRVVRPRLADARFFFETDKKTKLVDRIPKLAKVVYHNKLGSQLDRTRRVEAIAKQIVGLMPLRNAGSEFAEYVATAASLAKADLLTDMVGEFPELQGTMGRYYAQADGLAEGVAFAIEDHYRPRFSGDALPRNEIGLCVALADKLATLAGMFSIGQPPTGDKDPFALRRQAIGVVRILVEKQLPVDISGLVGAAVQQFGLSILVSGNVAINEEIAASNKITNLDTTTKLTAFIFERFAFLLKEQGFSTQEIDAVLSLLPERLSDVPKRLEAVRAFMTLPQAQALASANKRIGNILKKSQNTAGVVDASQLVEPAERALHAAVAEARPVFDRFAAAADYAGALASLATLKAPVDAFFDGVMVNAENPKLRANRLALLSDLHALMNKVADLSKLAA